MSGALADLVGRNYGPFHLRSSVDRIDEFALATGDDPSRWEQHAPPGFAAVILFESAPSFFDDPDAAAFTKTLVHVDQTFEWPRPLPQEEDLAVTGTVESVRQRGELPIRLDSDHKNLDRKVETARRAQQILLRLSTRNDPGHGNVNVELELRTQVSTTQRANEVACAPEGAPHNHVCQIGEH